MAARPVGADAVLTGGATDPRFRADGTRIGDAELRVVEPAGRPCDAFIMHCDTFLAGAPNCHDQPRLMVTNLLVRTEDFSPRTA